MEQISTRTPSKPNETPSKKTTSSGTLGQVILETPRSGHRIMLPATVPQNLSISPSLNSLLEQQGAVCVEYVRNGIVHRVYAKPIDLTQNK